FRSPDGPLLDGGSLGSPRRERRARGGLRRKCRPALAGAPDLDAAEASAPRRRLRGPDLVVPGAELVPRELRPEPLPRDAVLLPGLDLRQSFDPAGLDAARPFLPCPVRSAPRSAPIRESRRAGWPWCYCAVLVGM